LIVFRRLEPRLVGERRLPAVEQLEDAVAGRNAAESGSRQLVFPRDQVLDEILERRDAEIDADTDRVHIPFPQRLHFA